MSVILSLAGLSLGAAVAAEVLRSACAVFNALLSRDGPVTEPDYGKALGLVVPALACAGIAVVATRFLILASPGRWLPMDDDELWWYPATAAGVFLPVLVVTLRLLLPTSFRRAAVTAAIFCLVYALVLLVAASVVVALLLVLASR